MPKKQEARWDVEGHALDVGVEFTSVGLAIPNPLRGQPLAVPPDIRLGDTPEGQPAILWSMHPIQHGHAQWGKGGTPEKAFWGFLELATEQRPDAFLTFAQRFGPLGLWPYKTADGHKVFGLDYWVPSIPDGIQTPFRYTTYHGDEYWQLNEAGLVGMLYEPVEEWRRWAMWTRAVADLAFALRDGCAPRRLWELIGYGFLFELRWEGQSFAQNVGVQRRELVKWVQHTFLKWSGLIPVIRWDRERPALTLALGGETAVTMRRASMQIDWPENVLFPALVGQLVAVITASEPVASCSRCGRLHSRNRKARSDQPAYCDSCRIEARRKTKSESIARARARHRERG